MDNSPPPSEPWVYKPRAWDHEDLHQAYPLKPQQEDTKTDIPPKSVKITLLDMKGEKTPPITLKIRKQKDAFELLDTESEVISFANLRYMSTNCKALCEHHVTDHRFIIMVSVREWEDMDPPEDFDVLNLFIQPESAENALAIMNFLRYHVFQYLKKKSEQEDPTSVLEFNCPHMLHECTAVVHWRRFRKTWKEKRIVVVDAECVILYREPFEDAHKPRDRLFFWLEQYRKTVNKVSRIKSENCTLLHSLYMFVKLYDEKTQEVLEDGFKKVEPLPKKALEDPKICFHWLAGNYDPITGKIRDPVPVIPPVELDEEEAEQLVDFERQLIEGLFHHADDQANKVWENRRPHLDNILVNEKLPDVDVSEWDPDINSVANFLKVVNLIVEELFINVNYDKALATTVCMKKAFQNTGVERLREFLQEDPVDILRKVHARGNVISQPSLTTGAGRQSLLLPPEDYSIPVDQEGYYEQEEEEEEEEDMEGVLESQSS